MPTLIQYLIMKMQLQDKFEEKIYLFIANVMSDNLSVPNTILHDHVDLRQETHRFTNIISMALNTNIFRGDLQGHLDFPLSSISLILA